MTLHLTVSETWLESPEQGQEVSSHCLGWSALVGTSDPARAAAVGRKVERDVSRLNVNMGCPKAFSLLPERCDEGGVADSAG